LLTIRDAAESDLDDLLGLYVHLHPSDEPLPSRAVVEATWREVRTRTRVFLGFINDNLVGSCTLAVIPNLTRGARPYALVENVVTHAEHRRKGIGRQMLQHAMSQAWVVGCYKVMLLTGSTRPETLRFYEGVGLRRDTKTGFAASAPTA
jgi:GNAT superfamily N-acetyltransferase